MGQLLLLSSDDAGTDGHYREVGEADSISNKIKLTTDWSADKGEYFKFVVKDLNTNRLYNFSIYTDERLDIYDGIVESKIYNYFLI